MMTHVPLRAEDEAGGPFRLHVPIENLVYSLDNAETNG